MRFSNVASTFTLEAFAEKYKQFPTKDKGVLFKSSLSYINNEALIRVCCVLMLSYHDAVPMRDACA